LKEDGSRFELNYKNRFEGDTLTQPLQLPKDDPLWKLYYEQKAEVKSDEQWNR